MMELLNEFLSGSVAWGVLLTLAAFALGALVNRVTGKAFFNPLLLGNFVGMLTDSRSFLSYTRHDYFRRILCNLIGQWVEDGEYPNDEKALEKIVKGICFDNAKRYFAL